MRTTIQKYHEHVGQNMPGGAKAEARKQKCYYFI